MNRCRRYARLNCRQVGQVEKLFPFGPSQDPLYLGGEGPEQVAFDGLLDDIRIYHRVLSAAEAARLYTPAP